jgi:propionyl-CoA synthetase
MGRTDDVINVAGHRLSTGEMEEVLAGHPDVAECAVIGISCPIKGQLPIGLVLLKDGADIEEQQLNAELVASVRNTIGALACFKTALIAKRLPKTRSGKILRKLLRQISNGDDYVIPSTIDDPGSIPEIEGLLREHQLVAEG